ncbi:hypothetical protein DACRYDRAFT_23263 [Dacryopinax primogenitus]|uniref:Uncharacterized protein n=1 Tax=Dacryopinax primogenitus (strain DJM 731) TaxID=1858805 RepID=M5FX75_DACPD|nr:uncharacterized protein DACRYDRAFT_23263 [Dacryopinax primogenitus]EJU00350.1 hypothetical protein DACRYDRAFT_23263 [Dacryopinax primogenitus]
MPAGRFRKIQVPGARHQKRITLVEDISRGWNGSSPLVISCWVPALALAQDTFRTRVGLGLGLVSTPFRPRVRPQPGHIHCGSAGRGLGARGLRRPNRPNKLEQLRRRPPQALGSPSIVPFSVTIDEGQCNVTSLTVRYKMDDGPEQQAIASGAKVQVTQLSPCTMEVTFAEWHKPFVYPFPVDGRKAKTRIARKSGYIEVEVPVSDSLQEPRSVPPGSYAMNSFPLLLCLPLKVPIPCNIHRLTLERLPVLGFLRQTTLIGCKLISLSPFPIANVPF